MEDGGSPEGVRLHADATASTSRWVLDEGTIRGTARWLQKHFSSPQHGASVWAPSIRYHAGWYYIYWGDPDFGVYMVKTQNPAGGVPTGFQLAMRSRSPYGPYEHKIVLAQGKTTINGPHQGGWVHTKYGEDCFLHFQDKEAYGRVVHLNPVDWSTGWPIGLG